jgi:hypothetical protein
VDLSSGQTSRPKSTKRPSGSRGRRRRSHQYRFPSNGRHRLRYSMSKCHRIYMTSSNPTPSLRILSKLTRHGRGPAVGCGAIPRYSGAASAKPLTLGSQEQGATTIPAAGPALGSWTVIFFFVHRNNSTRSRYLRRDSRR